VGELRDAMPANTLAGTVEQLAATQRTESPVGGRSAPSERSLFGSGR